MSDAAHDPTAILHPQEQEWISTGLLPGRVRVIKADEELGIVIFSYRFDPGTPLPTHRHDCHAIAYTISGEWAYESGALPAGSLAYEPVGSEHTPSSENGAELIAILRSETGRFLVNYMEDGSELVLDMAFFKALEGATQEEAERVLAQMRSAETA
jgi:anti-sigma factor ChrR (cupin superfamily)